MRNLLILTGFFDCQYMIKSILKAVQVLYIAVQRPQEQILHFNFLFNTISLPESHCIDYGTSCLIITWVGFTEVIFRCRFCFKFENSIIAAGLVNYTSLYISMNLLTYPSSKLTFCPKWEERGNVGLGEG